ncbi:hypothetical protein K4K61_004750 [Colletotrichum sp. SAR11_59]|nr:hypothetical protein K4K61_004750 [Colletotrichum sp. SAR11_59]
MRSILSLKQFVLGTTLLPALVHTSPVPQPDRVTVPASLQTITPNIVQHGPLDDAALAHLQDSLTASNRPTPSSKPSRAKRQAASSATGNTLTIATSEAFVSVDVGDITLIDNNPADCHSETLNGPLQALQVFMGAANIRAMNITASGGNTTSITSWCDIGLIGHVGLDFIDDLQSVSISNLAYSGFTDNIMPSGPGTTVTMITIMTMDAVTKFHTVSVANMWTVGGKIGVETEAGIPFIGKSKVSTEFNWQVGKTTTEEDTQCETLTKSSTVNLKCPAKKYCVGSSFYTSFKMGVDVTATFRATTKTGKDFFWEQKGKYSGADSLALQLQVDEADGVIKRSTAMTKHF